MLQKHVETFKKYIRNILEICLKYVKNTLEICWKYVEISEKCWEYKNMFEISKKYPNTPSNVIKQGVKKLRHGVRELLKKR